MYNAVGIDVSKGKSTVAVLQPGGTVIRKPFDVSHTSQNLNELAELSGFTGWRIPESLWNVQADTMSPC